MNRDETTAPAFVKMHGLGNDFVLLDHIDQPREITPELAARLADRRLGVGCDQVVQLLPSRLAAHVQMRIFNPDGSRAEMCGNAARCVAHYLKNRRGLNDRVFTLETLAGPIRTWFAGAGDISVDMGVPELTHDGQSLKVGDSVLPFTGVSMGNPHCVIFTDAAETLPLATLGPAVEHHALFPDRTNVELVRVVDRQTLRMRVWERGAGITPACGTGACAAAVAAIHGSLTQRRVTLILDGGRLEIEWRQNQRVIMTGPATEVFDGVFKT